MLKGLTSSMSIVAIVAVRRWTLILMISCMAMIKCHSVMQGVNFFKLLPKIYKKRGKPFTSSPGLYSNVDLYYRLPRKDTRNRRDRAHLHNTGFKEQLLGMVDSYLVWSRTTNDGLNVNAQSPSPIPDEHAQDYYLVTVVDIASKYVWCNPRFSSVHC